jgi:hypothetical protein
MWQPLEEPTYFDAFKGNPFFILFTILAGAAGIAVFVVAVIAAMKRKRSALPLAIGAVVLGALTFGLGAYGTAVARDAVDKSASYSGLSANDSMRLRKAGNAEASYILMTGLVACALPILGGACAIFLARARSKKTESP